MTLEELVIHQAKKIAVLEKEIESEKHSHDVWYKLYNQEQKENENLKKQLEELK